MILGLSFISGAAGLIFEVLWARRLALLFGSTALAQTLVLAVFLGGLSAGSALLGRRADRAASAARFYSLLEWAVAALGLAAPFLLRSADGAAGRPLAVAALFAQAFLMGGTIPALCRAAGGDAQGGVGRVYAANSAGAAAGALAAAFLVVPALGLEWGFAAAAALNILAALGAGLAPQSAPAPARTGPGARTIALDPAVVQCVVFVSGFTALTYEIAWTRLLALVLGSSVYSFAEMLAAFIAGAALGSWIVSTSAFRRRDPASLLGLALLGAGVAVLAALPLCDKLPILQVILRTRFGYDARAFYAFEAVKFALCLVPMLLPAVGLGMTLPLAARLLDGGGRGGDVGKVFAANTAGNVLGALTGWLVLPWLGAEGILRSGTTVFVVLGAAVLWTSAAPFARRRAWAAAGLTALIAYRAWLPRWDMTLLGQGFFRSRPNFTLKSYADYLSVFGGLVENVYARDDREATVTVSRFKGGVLALKVNGKSDASSGPDMRTQILLGELPLILKPGAQDALVVGWGSGVTAGSMLSHPLAHLDAVELIPAVVDASRFFDAENGGARADPRLNLRIEDAKSFLARDGRRYDVIVSEPSNPWMAGVGDLFSVQFYRRARARLAPGGVMAQWFHSYEMDDALFALVLRTFASSFPHVTLWSVADNDLIIIGSDAPLDPDFQAMERESRLPAVRRDLARADVNYLTTLLAAQSASERTAAELKGAGPLNEELRPRLEYAAPKAFFLAATAGSVAARDDRDDARRREDLLLAAYLKSRGRRPTKEEYLDRVVFPHAPHEMAALRDWLGEWKRRYPRDPRYADVVRILGRYGRL
ncbi:MAG: fused MFS/spermidine synthase [Elusimicrobiota bacterium]